MRKKIKILGFEYDIIQDKLADKSNAAGSVNTLEQKIWIDINQHEEKKQSSLVHEVLEELNEILNIRLKHPQIELLEAGLFSVMKENKLK